jgi:hypothetical protein
MPVGTRNQGEGPNPDTKHGSPHLHTGSAGTEGAAPTAGRAPH